uniref:Uncharacterized protein n=1 Tax=Tanacetum cinerariifolium TaxID=118510 RepID=A0A6L2LV31_TANCI|nr:hypothetical protein [Tanacetum cinerariifolium]
MIVRASNGPTYCAIRPLKVFRYKIPSLIKSASIAFRLVVWGIREIVSYCRDGFVSTKSGQVSSTWPMGLDYAPDFFPGVTGAGVSTSVRKSAMIYNLIEYLDP